MSRSSMPGLSWEIERPNEIHIRGYDLDGNEVDIEADELLGRLFQHEFDHLMGKVYLDRMRDFQTLTHLQEFQRYWLPEEIPSPSGSG